MFISILWLFVFACACEGSIDHELDLTVQQLFPSGLGEEQQEQQRYFRASVDILGNVAVVGAPDQSSMYIIFRRDDDDPGKAWVLDHKFEGEPGSNLGASVAIVNEDLFAAGGPNFAGEEDENGERGFERGYVALISYREGTNWIETERLVTSVDDSHLGYTVVAQPTMDFLTTTMLDGVGGSGVLMYYKIVDNSTGSLEFSSSVLETTQPFNNEITNLHYGLNMAVNREILVAISRTGPCGRASVMRFDEPYWRRMETLIKCEHADDENDVLTQTLYKAEGLSTLRSENQGLRASLDKSEQTRQGLARVNLTLRGRCEEPEQRELQAKEFGGISSTYSEGKDFSAAPERVERTLEPKEHGAYSREHATTATPGANEEVSGVKHEHGPSSNSRKTSVSSRGNADGEGHVAKTRKRKRKDDAVDSDDEVVFVKSSKRGEHERKDSH